MPGVSTTRAVTPQRRGPRAVQREALRVPEARGHQVGRAHQQRVGARAGVVGTQRERGVAQQQLVEIGRREPRQVAHQHQRGVGALLFGERERGVHHLVQAHGVARVSQREVAAGARRRQHFGVARHHHDGRDAGVSLERAEHVLEARPRERLALGLGQHARQPRLRAREGLHGHHGHAAAHGSAAAKVSSSRARRSRSCSSPITVRVSRQGRATSTASPCSTTSALSSPA
jgi:hypothetical protein